MQDNFGLIYRRVDISKDSIEEPLYEALESRWGIELEGNSFNKLVNTIAKGLSDKVEDHLSAVVMEDRLEIL